MSATERHNPESLFKGRRSLYSHCVRVTNAAATLYLAGQLVRDEHGRTVGVGDVRAQAERVIENIRDILRAEGGDKTGPARPAGRERGHRRAVRGPRDPPGRAR